MHEDPSVIYKATKKNNNSKCGFNSIYSTLPNLDPELIIFIALKVHVRGPWQ